MQRIVIIAAKRTPQGRYLGTLSDRPAVELAVLAARAALEGIRPEAVDLVILGNVLGAGQGMNVARQVGVKLGLPLTVPAYTVNMMCASGMQAVALGAQAIRAGEARVVLCGGAESMSNAPYLLERARTGYKIGDGQIVDAMLRDGLVDAFSRQHMGLAAEALARQYRLTRRKQDSFALRSHQRYFQALDAGRFQEELVALEKLSLDEHARRETTLEKLGALKPAFDPAGTVTAGNASGINDGAAMLVITDGATAAANSWTPLAVLEGWAVAGCEPEWMGLGPVHAARKLCAAQQAALSDFDTIEINEAFAAQTLACLREMQLEADARLNPDGGAIAMGHPIGASGARLVTHLAHRIRRGETRRGLAALCVGGGMGIAMSLRPA